MNITFLHQSAQYTLLSLTCKDSFQVTLNSIGASIRSIGYTDSAEKLLCLLPLILIILETLCMRELLLAPVPEEFPTDGFLYLQKNITLPETKKTGIACIAVFIVFPL